MKEFDIISIGGGSGGIATMNRAGEYGARAAVIEEKAIGVAPVSTEDVCLKRIMWYGAQIAEAIRDYGPDYGFTSEQTKFDFATLRKKFAKPILTVPVIPMMAVSNAMGLNELKDVPVFVDAHTVEVNGEPLRPSIS